MDVKEHFNQPKFIYVHVSMGEGVVGEGVVGEGVGEGVVGEGVVGEGGGYLCMSVKQAIKLIVNAHKHN